MINCRSHAVRVSIVQEYVVTPVAQLKLLKGQHIKSDAGGEITDVYFVFRAERRMPPHDELEIICGYHAAGDFCNLLNVEKPAMFSPLKLESPPVIDNRLAVTPDNNSFDSCVKWNPRMLQLYNATMILLSYWPHREDSVLMKIAERIRPYRDKEPFVHIFEPLTQC